jgi:MFS family permease
VCTDIAPDHAGVITGWMNTFGNLGGFIGPLVVGYAIDRWQSWTIPFYIAAVIYVIGAVAWLAIDPERALARESREPAIR